MRSPLGGHAGTGSVTSVAGRSTAFGHVTFYYGSEEHRPNSASVAQAQWVAELDDECPPGPVLELCAGVGAIGLLAIARIPRLLVSVEADPSACEHARRNASEAGLAGRVEVRQGEPADTLRAGEHFALVIAYPPCPRPVNHLRPDPDLVAEEGLEGVWNCLTEADRRLLPGGSAIMQLGSLDQATTIRDACETESGLDMIDLRAIDHGVLVRFLKE